MQRFMVMVYNTQGVAIHIRLNNKCLPEITSSTSKWKNHTLQATRHSSQIEIISEVMAEISFKVMHKNQVQKPITVVWNHLHDF